MSAQTKDRQISAEGLKAMASSLLDSGYLLISEAEDGLGFKAVKNGEEISLRGDRKPTNVSYKELVLPRTEPLFHFSKSVDDVSIVEPTLSQPPRIVVFGARPCDAKSIQILSKVFNWDYKDEYFNSRADNIVVIGMLCRYTDDRCFCTSVGLSPSSTAGSDIFLVPADDGSWTVRIVTEKGARLLEPFLAGMSEARGDADKTAAAYPGPELSFDASKVREWIGGNFEHALWNEVAEACLGCAQCAFVCPVCHCFDIVDEKDSYSEGRRMKNWDACQAGIFTKHASGHNPRNTQSKRYRQRMSHKFSYYPERFGEILCTGCGRCSRGCAAGIDIREIAARIAAAHDSGEGARGVPAA